MDQTTHLMATSFVTIGIGVLIVGAAWLVNEARAKAYCICGHEFNEHWVVPAGMKNPMESEKCKVCVCKSYRKNDKDKRNTP